MAPADRASLALESGCRVTFQRSEGSTARLAAQRTSSLNTTYLPVVVVLSFTVEALGAAVAREGPVPAHIAWTILGTVTTSTCDGGKPSRDMAGFSLSTPGFK